MADTDLQDWTECYSAMLTQWNAADNQLPNISDWGSTFNGMSREMGDLKSRGEWRSGSRTLLRELGIDSDELLMCRGLAWLLTPDAWHGLGDRFLRNLLLDFGLPTGDAYQASVSTEEIRGATRADIVVRTPAATVVFEAKMFAPEHPSQCDLIADAWDEEKPHLVFLSRNNISPTTAIRSANSWTTRSWRRLADLAETAIDPTQESRTGELDFIDTLKTYGG